MELDKWKAQKVQREHKRLIVSCAFRGRETAVATSVTKFRATVGERRYMVLQKPERVEKISSWL